MKILRYRKPSASTVLGVTRTKKRLKRATGITQATRPLRALTNAERRLKRRAGYYSAPARLARTGKIPTPLGCLLPAVVLLLLALASAALARGG